MLPSAGPWGGWTLGTLLLLFQGVRTIVSNWRLTLVELTPAVWIGLTWWDLRVHALRKLELTAVHGLGLVVVAVGVIGITVTCYWCNATFAMTLEPDASGSIRDAFTSARRHAHFINAWGFSVGIAHAIVSTVLVRAGLLTFSAALAAVATVMMISFVTVPARLLGGTADRTMSMKISGTAVGGLLSVVAQTPGFLLNRIGLLLLGVQALFIPGIAIFAVGVALQTAAVSSVSAVKLSTEIVGKTAPDQGGRKGS